MMASTNQIILPKYHLLFSFRPEIPARYGPATQSPRPPRPYTLLLVLLFLLSPVRKISLKTGETEGMAQAREI
ncbi:hypothetical protein LZ32DRAFT_609403 [Colletotrichum eremochloae]|nr:hypothetical protein LZ32DRAFT_609403 [Colletotrichum eremochloae]